MLLANSVDTFATRNIVFKIKFSRFLDVHGVVWMEYGICVLMFDLHIWPVSVLIHGRYRPVAHFEKFNLLSLVQKMTYESTFSIFPVAHLPRVDHENSLEPQKIDNK